jgi:hypothetical protein
MPYCSDSLRFKPSNGGVDRSEDIQRGAAEGLRGHFQAHVMTERTVCGPH